MNKCSVLIVARNEEKNIADCIKSVDFADEIVVIDDFSTDKTAEIATSLGARVVQRAMNGDWSGQQNFSLQQATHDWVLLIDADERVTPKLAQEIQEKLASGEEYAYRIKRLNHFRRKLVRFGALHPDFVTRLLPKKDFYLTGQVHPKLHYPYPEKKLKNPMLHYTYDNWDAYYRKFDQYTKLIAIRYKEENKKSVYFLRDIVLRPIWAFFKVYIIHLGFLDGKLGWIFAMNHYFYTMTKYVRFYEHKHYAKDEQ
ncbi:MAG: glycosyltransferase family 2 protein [Neisseriaceae bacterium]|nr:glycosyltransferase family 2 protein [Neisseriaceae bacterium]